MQRSVQGGRQGLTEEDFAEVLDFERSERFDDRQKAALKYAQAIVWDASWADDVAWERLHEHFSDPELVELGFFIALTLGQQKWINTLHIGHRQVLGDTVVGLRDGSDA